MVLGQKHVLRVSFSPSQGWLVSHTYAESGCLPAHTFGIAAWRWLCGTVAGPAVLTRGELCTGLGFAKLTFNKLGVAGYFLGLWELTWLGMLPSLRSVGQLGAEGRKPDCNEVHVLHPAVCCALLFL